ncbi:MAG: DNA repair protein RecO [Kiritimatiellia bacterium]|jgi:DNA repair protein RecO
MIAATDAIALRIHPFSNTSHMVTWLSREFGRISTSIKGACRPKSFFLGQYDVGATCQLLFYRRGSDGVHPARECSPIRRREGLREDWRKAAAAGYACDFAARLAQPLLEAPDLFALLEETLDRLEQGQRAPAIEVMAFEFAALRLAGFTPNLELCEGCSGVGGTQCRFALNAGRPACHRAPPAPGEPTVMVPPDVLQALLDFTRNPACGLADSWSDPQIQLGLNRFLSLFIGCHLDVPPGIRRAAFEWMAFNPRR